METTQQDPKGEKPADKVVAPADIPAEETTTEGDSPRRGQEDPDFKNHKFSNRRSDEMPGS